MSAIILGGGLSGLSAAYYLLRKSPKYQIALLEASNRLGGWIKSNSVDNNIIFEEGPRTIRPHGPAASNTLSLIEDIGLIKDVIPIYSNHPAAKNRMIYVNKQLHFLPSSIGGLFKTLPPFSKPLVSFLLQDMFAVKKDVKDDSIYEFTKRRFGEEMADNLISAMICGICAGNSREISVNFLMKTLFEYEQRYGNIYKGLLMNAFKRKNGNVLKGLALKAKKERWNFYSFKNGLESLTKALDCSIKNDVSIELNSKCNKLEISRDGVVVELESGKSLTAPKVISTISSESLGKLLESQHPELAMFLNRIKSVTVAVVNVYYNKPLLKHEGFGFLVPPKEKLPILGVTYDSSCFPKGDNTVLTVMMGGAWFEQLFGKHPDKERIFKIALEQLKLILGINETPVQFKVSILENCIPQYRVGHNENLGYINKYIDDKKLPLSLCGSSYYGVGVNDVILSAKNAVEKLF
ncbi:protoporphyrinogen oxidase [Diorhabda sublineata]|uniref:protoporphyrinogen oxidase n=1 Tax=Diorhabda sublineata TaxID=1163346 RepID=UPI0024E04395|nr:protoporphyrinogen oxidase [Diorhabda sublineata]